MPDDQTQDAGASTTDQTSDQPQTTDAGASSQSQQGDQQAPKPDSANKLIKDFAKERGLTVEALLDQFTTLENASKTEKEKLESDLTKYKTEAETSGKELRELRGRVALQDAVSALGNVYDPATVVDLAVPLLEYGDDGKPANIDAAIAKLKETRPKLFPAAAGSGDGGKGGTAPTSDDMNAQMRKALGYKQ